MRVTAEHLLHLQRQPVHAFPHFGSADRQPNPHPGRNRDHRRASTSSTRSNAAASTSRSTRTRRPPASSISISPAFLRRRRRGASLISAGLSAATGTGNAETSLVISTATKDGSSEAPGTPITPSSASRRHLYNCAGNSPCRRAIADRFAPGAVASASTANFCSTLNRRRRSMRPRTSAPRYNIDLALLLAPVPSQHPASSSRRSQGGRHRRDTKRPRRRYVRACLTSGNIKNDIAVSPDGKSTAAAERACHQPDERGSTVRDAEERRRSGVLP